MNNLNSVLLEGTLETVPHIGRFEDSDRASAYFTMVSRRAGGKETHAKVWAFGPVAVNCAGYKKGRGLRVVGRIIDTESGPAIEAEYIEWKPQ